MLSRTGTASSWSKLIVLYNRRELADETTETLLIVPEPPPAASAAEENPARPKLVPILCCNDVRRDATSESISILFDTLNLRRIFVTHCSNIPSLVPELAHLYMVGSSSWQIINIIVGFLYLHHDMYAQSELQSKVNGWKMEPCWAAFTLIPSMRDWICCAESFTEYLLETLVIMESIASSVMTRPPSFEISPINGNSQT